MTRKDALDMAAEIVTGNRQLEYGDPDKNFANIRDFWHIYLRTRCHPDTGCPFPLRRADVAIMLLLLKVARISANPAHLDSYIDIAGYAALAAELADLDSHTCTDTQHSTRHQ